MVPSQDDDSDSEEGRTPIPNWKIISLTFAVAFLVLLCMGWPSIVRIIDDPDRKYSSNKLKQIGLAIQNYAEVHDGELPTNSYDPNGTPLLSWRVHLLPYIEYDNHYRQFHLDEPWDSPHNLTLLDHIPMPYAKPGEEHVVTKSYYRGFSSPGALFDPAIRKTAPKGATKEQEIGFHRWPSSIRLDDIKDGAENTILVVEAGDAVEWTKPDDLDASPGRPFPALGGVRPDSRKVLILFADGSVRGLKKSLPESTWRAAITHSGGEPVNLE